MSDVKHSRRPVDNAFQQQRLNAWQPLLTPKWVILTFTIVGVIFIPLGVVILEASEQVVEFGQRYDNAPQCKNEEFCEVEIKVSKDMEAPVYVYYELRNFYQNHRRYVKSRSDPQLRGESVLSDLSSCDPLESWGTDDGSESWKLYPCGLIANSYFNDTFFAEYEERGNIKPFIMGETWFETDIAWDSDKKEKFKLPKNVSQYDQNRIGPGGFMLPLVTDEHFIVWMRTAGLPTFKKLYARIPHTTLKKGSIMRFNVTNVFPVKSFDGEKHIVISTVSWLGGKNNFLGITYIVVGSVCWALAFLFFLKNHFAPRTLGDMKYFNWRKNPNLVADKH